MTKAEYDRTGVKSRVHCHFGNRRFVCQVTAKGRGKLEVFAVGRPDLGKRWVRYQSCDRIVPTPRDEVAPEEWEEFLL